MNLRWYAGVGLLATLVLFAGPAQADEIPEFDMTFACAARAGGDGLVTSCLRREQALRLNLTERWNVYPDFRKHFCVQEQVFRRRELRSYEALKSCLDDAKVS